MELNEQRRDLWEVVRKYDNQPFVQISAHKEIHALIKSIMQLYETLPLILNNDNSHNPVDLASTAICNLTNSFFFLIHFCSM